jgi:hypothetical protein
LVRTRDAENPVKSVGQIGYVRRSDIIVESYEPASTSGLHGPVHIRPVPGQIFPTTLQVECSKTMVRDFPVGTKFRIKAKLTDREGGCEFLYTYFGWPYEVVD